MQSTHTAIFPFPHMPLAARHAHIFPDLANKALIFIGELCNNGFTATFNTTIVSLPDGSTNICGNRDPKNGLYYLDLVAPPTLIPLPLPPFQFCNAYEMRTNYVGTKLNGRPRPLRGLDPSLVPEPRTRITVT